MTTLNVHGDASRSSLAARLVGLVPDLENPSTPDIRPLPRHKPVLRDILQYRHEGVVERLVARHNMSRKQAKEAWTEMLHYLYGTERNPGSSPSETADTAWHCFILFTRDYAAFCQTFFGQFIHHQPLMKKGCTRQCNRSGDSKCSREPSCRDVR